MNNISINGKLNVAYYSVIFLLIFIIGSTYLNLHQMENRTLSVIEHSTIGTTQSEQSQNVKEQQLVNEIAASMEESIKTAKIKSIIIFIASVIISFGLVTYLRKMLIGPLVALSDQANILAEGDLSKPDIELSRKDEIGQLVQSFNKMKNNLTHLIGNVLTNVHFLSESSNNLATSILEVTASSEEMTSSITQASKVANNSLVYSMESARSMEETAIGINRIAEGTQSLHKRISDTNNTAKHGANVINQAQVQMESIYESTEKVSTLMGQLTIQTEQIESMAKIITSLTDQTNLLALNAAIEAARAGEHGKGFAVVADEVRKLAEESKKSADSITTLTDAIKRDTFNVELAAAGSMQSVNDGVKIISEAGQSFLTITGDVEQMTIQVQEISAASEQLSASAEQVTGSVNGIAAGLKVSSNDIESIALASEDQAKTIDQISMVAATLNERANDLQKQIQHFRI